MSRYRVFLKSIVWMMGITLFFLVVQSFVQFNLFNEIKLLVSQFSMSALTVLVSLFLSHFSLLNIINTLFLVSLLFLCIYGFKWILDQGAFYTFEYSWQKTKQYVFFFLPKYWPSKKEVNKDNDYDLETGEKIYHTFEEFYEHKQASKWEDLNQLFCSAIVMVILTLTISFTMI